MPVLFPTSNFHSGLIFVIIVAIPFLIALSIVHITFGVLYQDSKTCVCDKGKNETPEVKAERYKRDAYPNEYATNNDTNTINIRSALTIQDINEFLVDVKYYHNASIRNPSIAALIEMSEEFEMSFKCPLAILSSQLALTTSNCIANPYKTDNLMVRTDSNYWWQEGELNNVLQIVEKEMYPEEDNNIEKWLAVIFQRPQTGIFYIFSLMVPDHYTLYEKKTYFWNKKDEYSLMEQRTVKLPKKYNKWGDFDSFNKSYSCRQEDAASLENAPIVSGRYLIGFHGKNDANKSICYYLKTFGIQSWVTELALVYF